MAIVAGDLNGDSYSDLIVVNQGSNNVSVMIGTGGGNFAPAVNYLVGNSPSALSPGDFNGDGKQDVAVLNTVSGTVSILLGQGDGTLVPGSALSAGAGAAGLAVSDFDGDGRADIAVSAAGGILIFPGLGNGTFSNPNLYSQFPSAGVLVAGAFSGDGRTSLVAALPSSGSVALVLNSVPTSTALSVSSPAVQLGRTVTLSATVSPSNAVGKVTFYDGITVLGSSPVSAGQAVFKTGTLAPGNHSLVARFNLTSGFAPSASAPAPLAVTSLTGSLGTTAVITKVTGNSPDSGIVADFTNDQTPDVAFVSSGQLFVVTGKEDGSFVQPGPTLDGGQLLAVADFNQDGNQDIASASYNVQIYNGGGDGTFNKGPSISSASYGTLAVADYNQDGRPDKPDLVVIQTASYPTTTLISLLGDGSGAFNPAASISLPYWPRVLGVADFNGDSKSDVLVGYSSDSHVDVLLGKGDGTFQTPIGIVLAGNPYSVAVADMNGDGKLDLAVTISGGTSAYIYYGQGNGTFGAPSTVPVSGNARGVLAADFNRDGRMDLAIGVAVPYPAPGQLAVFLGVADSLGVVSGTPQTAAVGHPFSQALKVKTTPGGSVTFTAPGSGASGTFSGGGTTAIVTAGSDGIAAAPQFTANATTGSYVVTPTAGSDSANFNLTNVPCTFLPSQPSLAFDKNGAAATPLSFTANGAACGWTVTSDSPWITVNTPSGTGSGSIVVTIVANSTGVSRTGNLMIGGAVVPATEWGTAQTFSDVHPSDYYFDAVNLLKSHNITTGCAPSLYCPQQNVTRAQMAILLVRSVMGGDSFNYSPTPYFTDVNTQTVGFKWIQKLYELGITTGCAPTLYCPDSSVTRDQMAVFIIRARLGSTAV